MEQDSWTSYLQMKQYEKGSDSDREYKKENNHTATNRQDQTKQSQNDMSIRTEST